MASRQNNEPWVASVAALVANACQQIFYPLETVRTRIQVHDGSGDNCVPKYRNWRDAMYKIWKYEGYQALFRGFYLNLIAGSVANMCFFFFYQTAKREFKPLEADYPMLYHFLSSATAGVVSSLATLPMWTTKTRLILHVDQKNSSSNWAKDLGFVVRGIWRERGIFGFWSGLVPSLFLASHGVIQMTAYEFFNKSFGVTSDNPSYAFFTGCMSKMCANMVLYPMMTVRSRLQQNDSYGESKKDIKGGDYSKQVQKFKSIRKTEVDQHARKYTGVVDCFRKTFHAEGVRGFYKGLSPTLIRIIPQSGLFFFMYEHTTKFLSTVQQKRHSPD